MPDNEYAFRKFRTGSEWAGTGASTVESSKKTDNIANNAKGRNLFRLLTVIAL